MGIICLIQSITTTNKIQLFYYFLIINYKLDFFEGVFIRNSLNTIYLAISAALICSISALLINFSIRFTKNKFLSFLSSTLTLGYAVPGLILAIGVMKLLTFLDLNFFSHYLELILTGSIAGLIIACLLYTSPSPRDY